MTVTLKEVANLRDLKTFIRFPVKLYRGSPYYVPALFFDELNTLRRERNPAFEHCEARYWLAYKDGQPAGRIAAILNRKHIEKWGQKYLRFGWIDFVDDPEVSAALLGAVETWGRAAGMDAVHGPLGFTDLDREGMLVEGFEEVATLSTLYNHPYYPQHLESLGYAKDTDWVEYEMTVPNEPDPTIARIADIAQRRYKLRLLEAKDKKELLNYSSELFDILDESYAHLYGTVPLTRKQVDAYVKQYFGFVQPDFVPVVLDENGKMVAFGITMPSLSKALQKSHGDLFPFGFLHLLKALRTFDTFDLYLVAVRQEYQGKGVNAILMDHMNNVFLRLGVKRVESNPELETNANVQGQWKYYQRRQHKRRRVFIKLLEKENGK
jgi:GNAT superfamily N-acetyltransferase